MCSLPGQRRHICQQKPILYMKIAFLISSMNAGGAERVAATLCNAWARAGHEVQLIPCFSGKLKGSFYELDPAVKLTFLADRLPSSRLKARLSKPRHIRELIDEMAPDVVVSFLTNVNVTALLALKRSNYPVVVCERTNPVHGQNISRLLKYLRKRLYPKAQVVMLQTKQAAQDFQAVMPRLQKISVIPNPLSEQVIAAAKGDLRRRAQETLPVTFSEDLLEEAPDEGEHISEVIGKVSVDVLDSGTERQDAAKPSSASVKATEETDRLSKTNAPETDSKAESSSSSGTAAEDCEHSADDAGVDNADGANETTESQAAASADSASDAAASAQPQPQPKKILIAVGRLVAIKRFHLLIRVFSRIKHHHKDWELHIYGDGPIRETLEKQIEERNMQNTIFLKGSSKEIPQKMLQADAFAMTSALEGFPNVLLEAMALGLPAICMDCPSGPAELSDHGRLARLVRDGDEASFHYALDELLGDPVMRSELGHIGQKHTLENYTLDAVLAQWDELFSELLKDKQ